MTAREIGDNWIAIWFGCGILAVAAIQYLFGGIGINNGFIPTWFTRKENPRAFWFWLGAWVSGGLFLIGKGAVGLL